jgi:hypothetical protein
METNLDYCNIAHDGLQEWKNTRKRVLVRYTIKFLCPKLNSLQTFNEGTVRSATHTVWSSVHTFVTMAGVTVAVATRVHPPSSGNALGNDET